MGSIYYRIRIAYLNMKVCTCICSYMYVRLYIAFSQIDRGDRAVRAGALIAYINILIMISRACYCYIKIRFLVYIYDVHADYFFCGTFERRTWCDVLARYVHIIPQLYAVSCLV